MEFSGSNPSRDGGKDFTVLKDKLNRAKQS